MNTPQQTVIFFVRHGLTDRAYSPDPTTDDLRVLSKQGRAQLRKVGKYLAQFVPTIIYTSSRQRTVESSELIAAAIDPKPPIEVRAELLEIYSNDDYRTLEHRIPRFFAQLVAKHAGEQIVCVSHQDVIQGGLDAFQLTEPEKDFPCEMGELYRLVFAGPVLAECQKARPAHEVSRKA